MNSILLAAAASDDKIVLELEAASGIVDLAWLILVLPLAGFVFQIFYGRKLEEKVAHLVPLAMSAASFVLSVLVFLSISGEDPVHRRKIVELFDWLDVGALDVGFDLLIDPLTTVMLLVVTGVGTLVHLYSIGYMHGDERYGRFFAFLNLFLFSMLVLVFGSSFLMLFIGWELVGLSSYLLIGFWFEKAEYAAAAKKAFITNRVGDVAFMVAMFTIFANFGTLDFFGVNEAGVVGALVDPVNTISESTAFWIGLMLAGGAAAKSAQIPLYVWLPDAMAGPTPVSALIHAATMVTAGVYLVARASSIFVLSQGLHTIIAWVGALTALMAALIALRQDDIKKILAYSTVSQLGYMFIGVGTGGYVEGVFHLMTHAFFKGLLFLAAGSVMHAFANRTNMWRMGGLRSVMPITFATSAIGWIAISGIPPFAGFWSKDQILTIAFEHDFVGPWLIGLITAAITAFYMSRWFFVTFLGDDSRWEDDVHPHESPSTMTIPLVILAGLSVVGGLVNIDHFTGPFYTYLKPVMAPYGGPINTSLSVTTLIVLSIVAAVVGIVGAWMVYLRQQRTEDPLVALAGLSTLFENKFYVDELYEWFLVKWGGRAAEGLAWFDRTIIDGAVNGVGAVSQSIAGVTRRAQVGLVRVYATVMIGSAIALVAFVIVQVG